jgi:hypothetical protein
MLNGAQPKAAVASPKGKRRTISAAGRKRFAEAQRQRWAAVKGAPEPTISQPKKRKRKLSAEGRAAIVAALKKRWAEKRAAGEKPQPVAASKAPHKRTVARKAA